MFWFQFTELAIPSKKRFRISDILKGIAIAAIYFGAAKLGLKMDAVSGFATLIWPPSGIAFVALFLLGYRFWPAITFAAFFVNYVVGASFWAAWGVAAGNTMEAVTAVWLLREFTDFDRSMERIKDVFWFLVLAAGLSTLVSATIGVSSLAVSQPKSFEGFGVTWAAWWMGDAMGDIIVAPIILVWATVFKKPRFNFWGTLEVLLLVLILSTICFLVFEKQMRLAFLIFPAVVWAALRFGQRGALTTAFAISVVFVWGVMSGLGPFSGGTFRENLYVLLSFLTISSTTGMILAASVAERKKTIRSRDEFLSITAHELKTPITTLWIHIEKTEMEIDVEKNLAPSPKVLAEVFATLMNQIKRLTNLVDNLLDVSRIDAGKVGFSFKEMNLSKLVTETVHQFSKELVEFRCDVKMDVQENIIIKGDATRLEQVMANLISNITKHASGSAVKISLREGGLGVRLIVEDRGPGIPKNLQAKIFERYERGVASPAVPGMGLGLLIVKELVKGHHGSIDLESDVGKGVKLTIQLPLRAQKRYEFVMALSYSDYLKLDDLLKLQKPLSEKEHDETLFIVIHQVYELWFKQILHEAELIKFSLAINKTTQAVATLKRILTILKTIVAQIDVLETITPLSFLSFRDRLESASGFQSIQFRELEIVLGKRSVQSLKHIPEGSKARLDLERRIGEPSLYDSFLRYLKNNKFPVPQPVLDRDLTTTQEESQEVQKILLDVYRTNPSIAQLCELLVDLDEGIQEWRYRHVKMVERTIGTKKGTGGSAGVQYLRSTLFQPLFPDLWAIRSEF